MGDHTKWNKVENDEEKKKRREALQKRWKAQDEYNLALYFYFRFYSQPDRVCWRTDSAF
jgi:hypothetical protein